jgi:outer membrane protein assembly factor BamD (BamD/ComL family)
VAYSKHLLLGLFLCISLAGLAQVGVDYTLVKPKKFENRVLASETSNNGKKFKKSRRFIQNTITHYNYYFNANEKIKMIVARAKSQFREDYTHLLPFYNYTLDATAAQKRDLDSVIYKCTAGILIHDTRNDWIDNLYLLIGKTYYFKKDFDSAYITLQFLNWAFAPKDKDGYYIPIGSNANEEQGGNADIVSTKENPNLMQKVLSLPPSRNDGFIWKIRTYIAKDQFAAASSLIEILLHDPQFPPRLMPSLQEVRALWFYKQNVYDSAAIYLQKALPAAETHEEMARWEYLIAQLYEQTNNSYLAKTFYEKVVSATYDPILEIYARLNAIKQNREGGADYIARNIEALVRMAHHDRFESYRDIIYYTAAQMELERKNKPGAIGFLRQSIRYTAGSTNNVRNKAFLLLANLSFEAKDYRPSKNFYDSLNLSAADMVTIGDISWLPDRKAALTTIVRQLDVIDRQDSLQRIALMPIPQRDAYIKKLVRILRRQQGLRDEADSNFNASIGNNNAIPDLFSTSNGTDWYFDNQQAKAKGYSDFKTKWGNRPDVDDWQVSSIMKTSQAGRGKGAPDLSDSAARTVSGVAINFKSLLANLPLTPEKRKKSMDSIEGAFFTLGRTYQDGLADYLYAINAYDTLLGKFPDTRHWEETLFDLYYCYKKLGDEDNAARILQLLHQKFPNGSFTARAINPDSAARAEGSLKLNATRQYDKIYIAFIEGQFDSALAMKKEADSLYGDKYWTPQLLYIESVYFIRTRQDQQARTTLTSIITKYPKTPMAAKAANMLDVLGRRRQIEAELTRLQVTRAKDDDTLVMAPDTAGQAAANSRPRLVRNDSNMLVKEDTSSWARAKLRERALADSTVGKPSVAGAAPAKLNANAATTQITMDASQIAGLRRLQDSLQTAMAKAGADSAQNALLRHRSDSIADAMKKLQVDTAQLAAKLRTLNSVFSLTPDKPHSVILVLDKVDPVYVSEAGNAFGRFNTENYYSKSLSTANASLSDSLKLVVINGFGSADDAREYLRQVKPLAPREIVPWLPAGKYTFLIISAPNLDLLLNNKDMAAYRKFLSAAYPGQF